MEQVLNMYKPQGMTPLQVLDAIRKEYSEYRMERMTYAGRLDPMAEGVLVVLVGDAVHEKERYMALDKEYEADIVCGVETDTHDMLGLPSLGATGKGMCFEKLEEAVREMEGEFEYALPVYSSRPVKGKPLFQWAREGRLDEIAVPTRKMHVHRIGMLHRYAMTADELGAYAGEAIARVQGDFRQDEILARWKDLLAEGEGRCAFPVVRVRIGCASGTYVRTLAHELGRRLGCGATLLKLIRVRVGTFDLASARRSA